MTFYIHLNIITDRITNEWTYHNNCEIDITLGDLIVTSLALNQIRKIN